MSTEHEGAQRAARSETIRTFATTTRVHIALEVRDHDGEERRMVLPAPKRSGCGR